MHQFMFYMYQLVLISYQCLCVSVSQEVEMFLMDALWVNERLHDYTTTVGSVPIKKQGEEGNEHGILDIEWSEDEDELAG